MGILILMLGVIVVSVKLISSGSKRMRAVGIFAVVVVVLFFLYAWLMAASFRF